MCCYVRSRTAVRFEIELHAYSFFHRVSLSSLRLLIMTSNKTIGNDDSNSKLPRRTRSLVWYAMAGLSVIAILLMNNDETIVDTNSPVEGEIVMEHGMVGVMTPNTPKPIQQISILGERNSGTRWLYRYALF